MAKKREICCEKNRKFFPEMQSSGDGDVLDERKFII
jgi:hypothetical protein